MTRYFKFNNKVQFLKYLLVLEHFPWAKNALLHFQLKSSSKSYKVLQRQMLLCILPSFHCWVLLCLGSACWSLGPKLLTRVVRHTEKAHWELVAHLCAKVSSADIFSFASSSMIASCTVACLFPNSTVKLAGSSVHAIVRNGTPCAVEGTSHVPGRQPGSVCFTPQDISHTIIMFTQQGPTFQTWWWFSESIQPGTGLSFVLYICSFYCVYSCRLAHFYLRGVTIGVIGMALEVNRTIWNWMLQFQDGLS